MENSVRRRLLDAIGISGGARVVDIPMDRIEPSRYQPRIHFDEQALQELAVSIQKNGLIQPITVREVDGHYEIIAGERRWRAARLAGLDRIAGYVLSPSETQAAEMALVENIQREDLTAVEEAKASVQIMRQYGIAEMPEEPVNIDDPEDEIYHTYFVLREQVEREDDAEVLKTVAFRKQRDSLGRFAFCCLTGYSWPPSECDAYSYRTYECERCIGMTDEDVRAFCTEMIQCGGPFADEAKEVLQLT